MCETRRGELAGVCTSLLLPLVGSRPCHYDALSRSFLYSSYFDQEATKFALQAVGLDDVLDSRCLVLRRIGS